MSVPLIEQNEQDFILSNSGLPGTTLAIAPHCGTRLAKGECCWVDGLGGIEIISCSELGTPEENMPEDQDKRRELKRMTTSVSCAG